MNAPDVERALDAALEEAYMNGVRSVRGVWAGAREKQDALRAALSSRPVASAEAVAYKVVNARGETWCYRQDRIDAEYVERWQNNLECEKPNRPYRVVPLYAAPSRVEAREGDKPAGGGPQ